VLQGSVASIASLPIYQQFRDDQKIVSDVGAVVDSFVDWTDGSWVVQRQIALQT